MEQDAPLMLSLEKNKLLKCVTPDLSCPTQLDNGSVSWREQVWRQSLFSLGNWKWI